MSKSKELTRRTGISLLGPKRIKVRLVRKPAEQFLAPVAKSASAPGNSQFGRKGWTRNLWETVQRNRWATALGFLVVFAPAVLWALLSPPVYESELRILVKRERPEAGSGIQGGPVSVSEVRSEIELLRSRELAEQVVARQGMAAGASQIEIEQAVRRLESDLNVGAVSDTNLIAMRYAGHSPKQAADVLNTLAALYVEKRVSLERNGEALEFFQEQAGYRGEDLDQAQLAMAEFAAVNEISLLQEQKAAALRRIESIEVQLAEVSGEIHANRRRLEQLRQQGGQLPQTVTTASRSARNQALIEKLKNLLLDLESQHAESLARYEPGYRVVVELGKKITDTRAALQREEQAVVVDQTESLNPIRQSVEAEYFRTQTELAGLEARQRDLRRKLSEQQARRAHLEALTTEHDTLARKLKLAEENYLRYEERTEQARIANALDLRQLVHVSIVEPAKVPALPDERYDALVVLMGFLLASCSGVGAAVARDRQHRRVGSAAEIAALTGLPVLSTAEMARR